jgi:hypothetical protein
MPLEIKRKTAEALMYVQDLRNKPASQMVNPDFSWQAIEWESDNG